MGGGCALGFSREEWLRQRIRDGAERQPGFSGWRTEHPLQARIWLAYCGYADSAFESMFMGWDVDAFQRSASAMAELASWLTNVSPQIEENLQETFRQFLNAGVPAEHAFALSQVRPKKRRGRPVSNRLPVLLAAEHQLLHPKLSWMRLAMKFCPCREPRHSLKCRNRLRIQARALKEMLTRLGV